ncbi:potassium channel AKT1-like, partial [Trifolium medium]|nr:potassium channel AKT1-like [Trifolium medium]
MEPVSFPANTSVILEHEVPTFLYFIARGSVDLIFPEDIIETVGPGNVFGETCVFFNTPQVFTATTREQSHFLMLDRVNLISILHGCPNDTSHMIGDYIDQVLSVSTNSHMTKLLEDFEDNAERVGRIDLPVSLMFAFERGYSRLFDRLVEEYPDLNESDSTGRTVLHRAASHGDVWKVNKLLGIGANPNSK